MIFFEGGSLLIVDTFLVMELKIDFEIDKKEHNHDHQEMYEVEWAKWLSMWIQDLAR